MSRAPEITLEFTPKSQTNGGSDNIPNSISDRSESCYVGVNIFSEHTSRIRQTIALVLLFISRFASH